MDEKEIKYQYKGKIEIWKGKLETLKFEIPEVEILEIKRITQN